MIKIKTAFWLTACAFAAWSSIAQETTAPTVNVMQLGKAAPAFTLKDISENTHALEAFKGSYVVLEWTNYDCPFVKKHYETGNMPGLQKKLTDEGVVWLTICSSAPGKQGNFTKDEWIKRMEAVKAAPKAVLLDNDGSVGRSYGAKNTPHLFVLNPEGVVIYAGAIDNQPGVDRTILSKAVNYVTQALSEAKAGKPISVPETKAYGCSVKY